MSFGATIQLISKRSFQIYQHLNQRKENLYEILKLKQNCTSQEIREAFVKLSKQHHPDVSGQKQSQQFIQINEAYQTLIKPKLRREYDDSLSIRGARPAEPFHHQPGTDQNATFHRPWEIHPDVDPNPSPHYYGIKGVKKLSNFKVALYLLGLCIFGAVFGFVSVKHSFTFNRRELDRKSAEASKHLQTVVDDAKKYGNEEQLKRMMERMVKNGT